VTTAPFQLLEQTIDKDGFAVVDSVLPDIETAALRDALSDDSADAAIRERNGSTYALRNLLSTVPAVRALAGARALRDLIEPILGPAALPVRGILFDKTPGANWKVAWHQDLSIAVRQRREIAGFGPWSVKAGVPHVQPPLHVLQNMLTIRLHLDDCDESNGPLVVLPGSHAHGVLSAADIARFRSSTPSVACTVKRGGVVLMRPLILHASAAATSPRHRRVVHIEYASGPLSHGLQWFVA
jgi:hypothetical protein